MEEGGDGGKGLLEGRGDGGRGCDEERHRLEEQESYTWPPRCAGTTKAAAITLTHLTPNNHCTL